MSDTTDHRTDTAAWQEAMGEVRRAGVLDRLSPAEGHLVEKDLARYCGALRLTGDESPQQRAQKAHIMSCTRCLHALAELADRPVVTWEPVGVIARLGRLADMLRSATAGLAAGGLIGAPAPVQPPGGLALGLQAAARPGPEPEPESLDLPGGGVYTERADRARVVATGSLTVSLRDAPERGEPGIAIQVRSAAPAQAVVVTLRADDGEELAEPQAMPLREVGDYREGECRLGRLSLTDVGTLVVEDYAFPPQPGLAG